MLLKLEIDSEDALQLCALHHAFMDKASEMIGEDPLFYSKAATITNNFLDEVIKKTPFEEIERLRRKK